MANNDDPFILNEGDPIPDYFDEAGKPHYSNVPLPRPRPHRKGDKPAPAPAAAPSGPDFGAPEYGMPGPEDPHPHAQYPMEDRGKMDGLLRDALAGNHGITGPLGKLSQQDQGALALALQNQPGDPAWTPGPANPIIPSPYYLPPGFDPQAAYRAWLQQSQHPNNFPDQDGRVFRTTDANI